MNTWRERTALGASASDGDRLLLALEAMSRRRLSETSAWGEQRLLPDWLAGSTYRQSRGSCPATGASLLPLGKRSCLAHIAAKQ